MANTKDDLILLFAPNDTNNIKAEHLQQFVTDVYDQMILVDDVVDTLDDDQGINRALSASRGYWLQQQLDAANATIVALEARITALEP